MEVTKHFFMIFILICTCVGITHSADQATQIKNSGWDEYNLRQARNESLPLASRLDFYNKILKENHSATSVSLIKEKAQLLEDNGLYQAELKELDKALSIAEATTDPLLSRLYIMRIKANHSSGLFPQILDDAFAVLDMQLHDSLLYNKAEAWMLLAEAFGSLQNLTLARQCIRNAEEILIPYIENKYADKENIRKTRLKLHGEKMNLQMALGNYDAALKELNTIEDLAVTPQEKSLAKASMTLAYQEMGEDSIAQTYYPDLLQSPMTPINKGIAAIHYIRCLIRLGRYKEAERIADNYNHEITTLNGRPTMGAHALMMRAEIAKNIGNPEGAMRYQTVAFNNMDSLFRTQTSQMSQDIAMRYDQWVDQHKLANEQSKREKFRAIILILAIILLTVSVYSWFLWKKHKSNRLEKLSSLSALAEIKQNHGKEMRSINSILSEKDNKLGALAMHLGEITHSLVEIKKISMQNQYSEKENLARIRQELKHLQLQDNLWGIYNKYFEEANSDFFTKLYKIHPGLTNAEVRMCAYVSMNLSSKEIANFTGRSIRTVQTIKSNLRKKLGIKISTEEYIRIVAASTDEELEYLRAQAKELQTNSDTGN